jgi:hypothetical protein
MGELMKITKVDNIALLNALQRLVKSTKPCKNFPGSFRVGFIRGMEYAARPPLFDEAFKEKIQALVWEKKET